MPDRVTAAPCPPGSPEGSASAPPFHLAERALARVSGARLIEGNRVQLLRDAAENYPAWAQAMLHAKTAVADGRWARVGSTNLNLQSWVGNWELDVAVEDEGFARAMAEMYQVDLEHATEIVLAARSRLRPTGTGRRTTGRWERRPGSASRAAAGAVSIGSAVHAAVTGRRVLGPAEARIMAAAGTGLLLLALLALVWPWAIALPVALLGGWLAVTLLVRGWRLRRARTRSERKGVGPLTG